MSKQENLITFDALQRKLTKEFGEREFKAERHFVARLLSEISVQHQKVCPFISIQSPGGKHLFFFSPSTKVCSYKLHSKYQGEEVRSKILSSDDTLLWKYLRESSYVKVNFSSGSWCLFEHGKSGVTFYVNEDEGVHTWSSPVTSVLGDMTFAKIDRSSSLHHFLDHQNDRENHKSSLQSAMLSPLQHSPMALAVALSEEVPSEAIEDALAFFHFVLYKPFMDAVLKKFSGADRKDCKDLRSLCSRIGAPLESYTKRREADDNTCLATLGPGTFLAKLRSLRRRCGLRQSLRRRARMCYP